MNYDVISFHMGNARADVLDWQRRVFHRLGVPLQQIRRPCPHGTFLTDSLRQRVDSCDAVVFFDIDCIPLRPEVTARCAEAACRRRIVIGCAQQANHYEARKYWHWHNQQGWPTRASQRLRRAGRRILGMQNPPYRDPLIYAGPCFLVVPTSVYRAVGQPSLEPDDGAGLDVGARLTVACRAAGYRVKCLRPTAVEVPKYRLGDRVAFGLGTTYAGMVYHAFESTYVEASRTPEMFLAKCRLVAEPTGQDRVPESCRSSR